MYIFINGLIGNQKYTLATIYAPKARQLGFLEEIFTKLPICQDGEILIEIRLAWAIKVWVDVVSKFI